MPKMLKLRTDVSAALGEWNTQNCGRGMDKKGYVTDPEVIARLERLALPAEDLNDTILRVLRGGATWAVN